MKKISLIKPTHTKGDNPVFFSKKNGTVSSFRNYPQATHHDLVPLVSVLPC